MDLKELTELQRKLDERKWNASIANSRDMCGYMPYCVFCEGKDFPCAKAYLTAEAVAKQAQRIEIDEPKTEPQTDEAEDMAVVAEESADVAEEITEEPVVEIADAEEALEIAEEPAVEIADAEEASEMTEEPVVEIVEQTPQAVAPVKRGRGRPLGAKNKPKDPNAALLPKRGRGRPRKDGSIRIATVVKNEN